ncbi:hypothetical protein [Chitinophaga sp.]|uniref:leucine-rich repeat domain-containing protein n=1 Tax=Chitinophaga sp. TaxID=1869181 RepID=UPI0031E03987
MLDTLFIEADTDLSDLSAFKQVEKIYIYKPGLDADKILRSLGLLPALTYLKVYASTTPITAHTLIDFPNLAELDIKFEDIYSSPNQIDLVADIVNALPALKRLNLNTAYQYNKISISAANMIAFDKLDTLTFFSEKWIHDCWFAVALTKHVHLENWDNNRLDLFREKVKGLDLTDLDLQILFALDYQLMAELNRWLPNLIMPLREVRLIKTQYTNFRTWHFRDMKVSYTRDIHEKDVIAVISARTRFDEAVRFLLNKVPVITIDHLFEKKMLLADAYTQEQELDILQKWITGVFDIAYVTYTSKAVHSALAAVMRTHPDRNVRIWARGEFSRIAPKAFFSHARKFGNALLNHFTVDSEKLQQIATHPDIDREIFMLMALTISQSKAHTFKLSFTSCDDLHPAVALFSRFNHWVFSYTKVNIEKVCNRLPYLTTLDLYSISYDHHIPENIGSLSSLEKLHISFHFKEAYKLEKIDRVSLPASIGKLTKLKRLGIYGKSYLPADTLDKLVNLEELILLDVHSTHWQGLQNLTGLKELILRSNNITGFPAGIFHMQQLVKLAISENDLSAMPDRLDVFPALKKIDLRNNKIKEFPYSLFKLELESVEMQHNELTTIAAYPYETRWGYVNLSNNQLSSLQFSKGKMHIVKLDISYNQLRELDPALFSPVMVECNARNNKISSLPEAITIPQFVSFTASDNCLTALPAFLKDVKGGMFYFGNNQITFVHPDIYNKKKGLFSLAGNPIPEEVRQKLHGGYL